MKYSQQKGIVAVEMALILTPMVVLCFGITELGRALYQYNGLVKATRSAVRYLSQQSLASPPAGETSDTLRNKARSLALCGLTSCGTSTTPLVPGLTLAMISVCDPVLCPATHSSVPAGPGTASLVTVTIGSGGNPFSFASFVPDVVPSIQFNPISITMLN